MAIIKHQISYYPHLLIINYDFNTLTYTIILQDIKQVYTHNILYFQ